MGPCILPDLRPGRAFILQSRSERSWRTEEGKDAAEEAGAQGR